jgi:hypothetical protein
MGGPKAQAAPALRRDFPPQAETPENICVSMAGQEGRRVYNFAPQHGAIAQLGERLHGMQEVDGSIPSGSTTFHDERPHRLEA